mmetsp:Transcript_31675/g.81152  ORF Transcript_31675/g.81152 Transcript_31675/m.81152 type:complete len:275 (-) Transcript_31675:64-888(-)
MPMSSRTDFISCISTWYLAAMSTALCRCSAPLPTLLGRATRAEPPLRPWASGLAEALTSGDSAPRPRSRRQRRSSSKSARTRMRTVTTAFTMPVAATPAALAGAQCRRRIGSGSAYARNSTRRKARRLRWRSVSTPATLRMKSTGTPRSCCSACRRRPTAPAAERPAASPDCSQCATSRPPSSVRRTIGPPPRPRRSASGPTGTGAGGPPLPALVISASPAPPTPSRSSSSEASSPVPSGSSAGRGGNAGGGARGGRGYSVAAAGAIGPAAATS